MRRIPVWLILESLVLAAPVRAESTYVFSYHIWGEASSRALIFIPVRVYYEASASVVFRAERLPSGVDRFCSVGIGGTGYVLRTLGFSGRALALLTADDDPARGRIFAQQKLTDWKMNALEYARRIRRTRLLPHEIPEDGVNGIVFERDQDGVHRNFSGTLPVKFVNGPPGHGLYFNIYPILIEMLAFYDHPCIPAAGGERGLGGGSPDWESPPLDYSARLNRIAALIESVIRSLVSVRQRSAFRIRYRVAEWTDDHVDICGEAHPNVPVWDGVEIREVIRRTRIGAGTGLLRNDEFYIGLRNRKGHGGYGRIQLKIIP